ncbi:MAG: NUDIX domain-containing protein [Acidobacteriia bacterium]|nr:NUDIX domain-containing protein [Terriglobia bacterium]
MEDWSKVRVFGTRPEGGTCVIRPSAYGVVEDTEGRLAVVCTPHGNFLPGGGIEDGETPEETIKREVLEECGLRVVLGAWTIRAVQFVYSESENTHFEKRSIFIEGALEYSFRTKSEADHELVWVNSDMAVQFFSRQSHCWAVEQWRVYNPRR